MGAKVGTSSMELAIAEGALRVAAVWPWWPPVPCTWVRTVSGWHGGGARSLPSPRTRGW